jgi:hypothetical protein
MTAGGGMPTALKFLAKFLFKAPPVGAGKLHRVAMDEPGVPAGRFVVDRKIKLFRSETTPARFSISLGPSTKRSSRLAGRPPKWKRNRLALRARAPRPRRRAWSSPPGRQSETRSGRRPLRPLPRNG